MLTKVTGSETHRKTKHGSTFIITTKNLNSIKIWDKSVEIYFDSGFSQYFSFSFNYMWFSELLKTKLTLDTKFKIKL